MKQENKLNAISISRVTLGSALGHGEKSGAHGTFTAVLRDASGNVINSTKFPNTVLTLGKNYLLDNGLAGSAFTAAFYLGLISSVSYSAIAVTDTAASHPGWLEAGNANAPTYAATRPTAAWAAASGGSKALSAPIVFTFTGAGTVEGCILSTSSAVDGTTGVIYSAGVFTGGAQPVVSGNTLSVSYTASI